MTVLSCARRLHRVSYNWLALGHVFPEAFVGGRANSEWSGPLRNKQRIYLNGPRIHLGQTANLLERKANIPEWTANRPGETANRPGQAANPLGRDSESTRTSSESARANSESTQTSNLPGQAPTDLECPRVKSVFAAALQNACEWVSLLASTSSRNNSFRCLSPTRFQSGGDDIISYLTDIT
jgi:hypothetical protein